MMADNENTAETENAVVTAEPAIADTPSEAAET